MQKLSALSCLKPGANTVSLCLREQSYCDILWFKFYPAGPFTASGLFGQDSGLTCMSLHCDLIATDFITELCFYVNDFGQGSSGIHFTVMRWPTTVSNSLYLNNVLARWAVLVSVLDSVWYPFCSSLLASCATYSVLQFGKLTSSSCLYLFGALCTMQNFASVFSRLNSGPKSRAAVPVSQSRRNFITVSCSSSRLFWQIFRQRSIHCLFSVSKKVLHSHSPVCAVTNSQANTGAVSLDFRWVANQTWIIRNSSAATPPWAWLCLPTCTHCYTYTVSPLVCLLSFSPSPTSQHKTLYVSSQGNRTSISKTVGLPMQLKLIRATFKCYSYQTQIRNAGQSSCKAPSLPPLLPWHINFWPNVPAWLL